MIATLEGIVSEKIGQQAVVLIAGVGYGVLTTLNNLDRVTTGEKTKFYIHENIKEEAHDLFGFLLLDDKKLFEQLLSVKNVGPKVAMSVLDIGSANDVRAAIASGDVKRLQTAKGVGKRAAEQIVVELRDKVGLISTDSAEDIVTRGGIDTQDEAAQALMSLGYSELDAMLALKNIDPSQSTENRVKQALKGGI
ncbi:MAG: ruvA [Candidatus Saccharibacteria bacterium]|nr:ruvA [Candidatus Saccharibacteria bacterium]